MAARVESLSRGSSYGCQLLSKETPMQYLIQIFTGEAMEAWERLSEAEKTDVSQEYFAINDLPGVTGGAQLQPPETATTVRVDDGRTLTTDGPFAATKEALGGYYLYEAENL